MHSCLLIVLIDIYDCVSLISFNIWIFWPSFVCSLFHLHVYTYLASKADSDSEHVDCFSVLTSQNVSPKSNSSNQKERSGVQHNVSLWKGI